MSRNFGRSFADARKTYAETIIEMENMEYTKGFLFQASNAEQGDADKPAMMNNREMKKDN